jgi:hypothetical protein
MKKAELSREKIIMFVIVISFCIDTKDENDDDRIVFLNAHIYNYRWTYDVLVFRTTNELSLHKTSRTLFNVQFDRLTWLVRVKELIIFPM